MRQITSELLKIAVSNPNLEVIPVKFDGTCITRVISLDEQNTNDSTQEIKEIIPIKKIAKKLSLYTHKATNKLKKLLPGYLTINNQIKWKSEFAGIKFSSKDIYIIADANWDLPQSYNHFLQHLKKHEVTIVSICYDLIPIKFPEFCSQEFVKCFREFYYQYSDCFDKVICISRQSAEDYIKAKKEGVLPSNNRNQLVDSFRLGSDYSKDKQLDNQDDNVDNTKIISRLNQRYILVVGSLVPHKNIKTIITAFDLLAKSNQNINLVFAGNRGWHKDTDILIEKNELYQKRIHIFDSVTDSQLDILYKNCYCLVQASFYEGFGLPVVEALQHSKPVISSNGGSLPEVGGDFCLYFDPNEPIQLYQALEKLVGSDVFYNQLVACIRNEYSPFSWQESAKQLISVLSIGENIL
ncbi:glycosyltransferase family 4 protein [Dolichospermum compactum]|uniref:glycosyltransferase family 4 protein n=1 Tax=Dolichospermum compactum TaxID=136073 RepID=UPI001E36F294|nr:glycosyltransferase family 1 protein [Dolichospermum compactum]